MHGGAGVAGEVIEDGGHVLRVDRLAHGEAPLGALHRELHHLGRIVLAERLGDLDMRLGDVRGALEAWRDQVATAPDHPGADAAQLKIARALADRGEYFAARGAASELQSRWPHSPLAPAAALLSASTFHLSGRHAEAIAAYRKVAQQFAGTRQEAEARFETGNCLVELGDDAHAVQEFTQALVRHDSPEVVQFAMERAQRRLAMGKTVDPKNVAAVFDHFAARNSRRATQH